MGFDMNYKIKIESNVEEIQDLFIQLGCKYFNHTVSDKNYMLIEDGKAFFYKFKKSFDKSKSKEITLPELRDLVVLKRNDFGDATHIRGDGKKYFHARATDFFYQFSNDGEWLLSTWMNYQLLKQLKPIEKKEMKEYLVKNQHDEYVLLNDVSCIPEKFVIEIPEGAEIYSYHERDKIYSFYKDDGKKLINKNYADWVKSIWSSDDLIKCNYITVLWQRSESPNDKAASAEQYRQAEVLPFIDDEPDFKKLADLLVETTKHRLAARESDAWIESNVEQDNVNNPSHYADGEIECIDAIESSMTHEAFCGYLKGNIQKYIWRYEKKGGIESLKKGQWYLNKLIEIEDEKTK